MEIIKFVNLHNGIRRHSICLLFLNRPILADSISCHIRWGGFKVINRVQVLYGMIHFRWIIPTPKLSLWEDFETGFKS